jgi:uncharacterized protein (TIGR03790 family)
LAVWNNLAHAGGGPQNVVLIVNPDDPDSLGVANYYIELRKLPASNVIYIPWRVDLYGATAVQFRDRLIKPVIEQLQQRGLTDQIDFLAFSSGYPYLIDCAPLFRDQQFPPQARPLTSLTSAMFFYQSLLNGQVDMFGVESNDYFAPAVGGVTKSRAFGQAPSAAGVGATSGAGKKFLLATALGVTHGHGNTGKEITASLRRAEQADGTKPRGTIYYMQNNDVRSKVRQGEFAAAVRELAAAGVKGVVLQGVAPMNKPDVAGLTTGSANVDLRRSGSTLLPGALVDNLTSAGGQMLIRQEGNPQTRISEYIRLGAAGASGAVIEPFAIPQKFPSPALHVHYARGCSLAEAFYQSVAAPFHLLIIGDPLCQPWAVAPNVAVSGVAEGATLSGVASVTATATYPDARRAGRFELYVDGVRNQSAGAGAPMSLDTTKLADGWHEVRVVAIDNTPIAVQGAWIGQVQVKNGDGVLEIAAPEKRVALAGKLTVNVTSTAPEEARVMNNGRAVGTAAGGKGPVTIDAKLLGKGRTTLHAEQAGEPGLRSQELVVEVY